MGKKMSQKRFVEKAEWEEGGLAELFVYGCTPEDDLDPEKCSKEFFESVSQAYAAWKLYEEAFDKAVGMEGGFEYAQAMLEEDED